MHTTTIGNRAEQVAAEYLERQGYHVVRRNWRQRDCEIDIIARKGQTMYFVEVKFRMTDGAGSGLEYITAQKLRQMAYAASRWVAAYAWREEYALAAVEVSGETFEVTAFVDDLY
jgi:putative endonuclease